MSDKQAKLLEELGGIGNRDNDDFPELASESILGSLSDKSEEQDQWNILLVELAYVMNASFRDVHYWEGVKSKQDTFREFVRILHELDRMPEHDRSVHIRYRGSCEADLPDKFDYIIQFGERVVDYSVVAKFIRRQGLRFKHYEGRARKAFESFYEQAVSSVTVYIPGRSRRSLESMQIALRIFSCYHQAAENLTPITFEKNGRQCSLMPVVDEHDQPDPNLTLLAALNDLNAATMRDLVQKVAPLAGDRQGDNSDEQYPSVFKTIFKVNSLREKLIKPLLEVNANGSLAKYMIQGETAPDEIVIQEFDRNTAIRSDFEVDPQKLKNEVAQFAQAAFKGSLPHAKSALGSVFARDYDRVNLQTLGLRFKLLSRLLNTMDKSRKGQKLIDSVLEALQQGIDQVPAELLDDLVVQDNHVKYWSGDKEIVVAKVDENLQEVIEVSKGRSRSRKNSGAAVNPYEQLEADDCRLLAERFDLTLEDAQQIIALFENCFDQNHHFQKNKFTKNIPEFLKFEKHIFEILWEFLKQSPKREVGVPFLNSFQFLIKETGQPLKAVKILLSDFITRPAAIEYSDRNAMMLANMFLRTYNKEKHMDIEITPEEVLLVKIGLNQKVAGYAAWRVDGEQNRFLEKIVNIRKQLIEALEASGIDGLLPVRFLLALEREVHIFLALAGGTTAALVLRSALKVYGNPESQVYHMKNSAELTTVLIQHLAALIRGFGRVGHAADADLLDEIKLGQEGFLDLSPKDPRHAALVKRIMGWIDMAKSEIGKIRSCFSEANESKMLNSVSASAEAPDIEASI